MKKYLAALIGIFLLLVLAAFIWSFFVFKVTLTKIEYAKPPEQGVLMREALLSLKRRDDGAALKNFEMILSKMPENIDALWGKAEVLRRNRNYKESEAILDTVFLQDKAHVPSLLSLAYIRYKDGKFSEGLSLINKVLKMDSAKKEDLALAYVLLGTINGAYASEGGLISKVRYGTRIKGYFVEANKLSPDMPEGHLALGTFYLLAPAFIGGNLNKAIEELEYALEISPNFATVNARLAQAYKMCGQSEKYRFYLDKTKKLDPENEILKEIN